MKGGFSLIVFAVMIAIGLYRYLSTLPSQRTDVSKKFFLKFSIGATSLCLGILLFGNVDPFITFTLVLFGFYFSLFNGLGLFSENPNKNEGIANVKKSISIKKEFSSQQNNIPKVNLTPTIKKETFEKPTYSGNVRCGNCGHIDKAQSFGESTSGEGFRKCNKCSSDFQYMSRYVGSTTYIGNYRCNSCHHQDEEKNFLPSSAGGEFRQCHMCGGHFQIN
jgi:hypothetical protein